MKIIPRVPSGMQSPGKGEDRSTDPTFPQTEIDRDRLIVALRAALRLLREHGVKPKATRGET